MKKEQGFESVASGSMQAEVGVVGEAKPAAGTIERRALRQKPMLGQRQNERARPAVPRLRRSQ